MCNLPLAHTMAASCAGLLLTAESSPSLGLLADATTTSKAASGDFVGP